MAFLTSRSKLVSSRFCSPAEASNRSLQLINSLRRSGVVALIVALMLVPLEQFGKAKTYTMKSVRQFVKRAMILPMKLSEIYPILLLKQGVKHPLVHRTT